MILAFVVPVVAAMVLFTFGICSVMRKQATSMIQLWRKTVITDSIRCHVIIFFRSLDYLLLMLVLNADC